jgi:replicative DNA helicase
MADVHHLDVRQDEPPTAGAPANIDAEQAILGAILFDNAAYERIGDLLRPTDFYDPFHARLFAAMEEHIRKGQLAEPIVLMERFRRDVAFEEMGGLRYLADLVDRAPPTANAFDYARVVHDLALRRELIRIGGDISVGAQGEADTPAREQIEAAEQQLYALAETGSSANGPKTFADVSVRTVEMAARAYGRDGGMSGLATGLIDLDKMLGGLQGSDLIILAARPAMGKSALAGNIAKHVARHYAYEPQIDGSRKTIDGGRVALFSLEMSDEQFCLRIQADASGIPSTRVRQGQIDASEFGRFRDAALELQEIPLHIDDTGGLAIAQLCARARRLKRTSGLELVIVDYLQLLRPSNGRPTSNTVDDVTEITGALKALAKELSVPVLALSQLSRQVEGRDNKRPQLSDLRASGSIEQDADVVMFLYREAYYLGRTEPRAGTPEHLAWQEAMDGAKHHAELIIGKQRHGPIGTVHLSFNEALTKFGNLARESHYEAGPAYRDARGGDR